MDNYKDFEECGPVTSLKSVYQYDYPHLESATCQLNDILGGFKNWYESNHDDESYVVSHEARAKGWNSVCAKLWDRFKQENKRVEQLVDTDIEQTFSQFHDLVGGRIVVSYYDKISPRVGLLKDYLKTQKLDVDLWKKGIRDKNLLSIDKDGYHAFHIFVGNSLENGKYCVFEIQVCSSFGHVWAQLMHPLVYSRYRCTKSGIPEEIKGTMLALGTSILGADQQLINLRKLVQTRRKKNDR